jgi:membrane-bound ClpP family serine protease
MRLSESPYVTDVPHYTMSKRDWSFKILVRYALLQLPEIGLVISVLFFIRQWVELPLWAICFISLVWVAKDIILFFFTWRAYEWDQKEPMIGLIGHVLDRLDPTGYIQIRGEKWRAEVVGMNSPIEKGQKVQVLGRQGLTLHIKPVYKQKRDDDFLD